METLFDTARKTLDHLKTFTDGNIDYVSVEDVSTDPSTRNKVISLFSGSGGLDLGLELAGFETVVCVEHDKDCLSTIAHNRPNWHLALGSDPSAVGDIRKLSAEDILEEAGIEYGEASLVVGGPPCQPFSNIGKKQGQEDPLNGDLVEHYVRIVKGCLPQGFIFENVEGFVQEKHSDVRKYLIKSLSRLGYSIKYSVLNAVDYGVPQRRRRFIMIGIRGGGKPAFPLPTHFESLEAQRKFFDKFGTMPGKFRRWRTVGDAFHALKLKNLKRSDYALMNISDTVKERMTFIGPGQNFKVLPFEMRPDCWKSGKHQGQDTFGRLRIDRPSLTVRTCAYNPAKGMYIHPTEHRGLSSTEMAALQSFPDSYEFKCYRRDKVTLVSVGKQIGNAVPPLFGKALGLAMKACLSENLVEH